MLDLHVTPFCTVKSWEKDNLIVIETTITPEKHLAKAQIWLIWMILDFATAQETCEINPLRIPMEYTSASGNGM